MLGLIDQISWYILGNKYYQALNISNKLIAYEQEAAVLAKYAIRLKECQDNWYSADLTQMLSEALKYNQKVWTFFQTELANPENSL
jgi:flagellar biosynthesis regulator FlaF